MPKLNRQQRREIQKYNKEKFDLWVGTYAMENYNAGVREMKIEYQCSNCGKVEKVSAMVGIPHGMFALGYRAVGNALYCPDCVKSWAERNGKPFDEQIKEPGHLFAKWWNEKVLMQAEIEHKQLKKYRTNSIGDYVEVE